MALSSNSIFHFTAKENLLKILEDGFCPRYCLEAISFEGKTKKKAIPMVCFCDIPLSQIKNHIERYGTYGIGLSKYWAKKNGINPVLYLEQNSHLNFHLRTIAKELWSANCNSCKHDTTQVRSSYYHVFRYIKAYECNNNDKINSRYYDEREWRFVPEMTGTITNDTIFYLKEEEFNNKELLLAENQKLKLNHSLKFSPKDIDYVIVEHKEDFFEMISTLEMFNNKQQYDKKDMDFLKSKIISTDQIINDF